MSGDDYGQITTIVHRLNQILSLLNPKELPGLLIEAINETAHPPPGDPDAIEALAHAHLDAAVTLPTIGEQLTTVSVDHLPAAWKGGAATAATSVLAATADQVSQTRTVFNIAGQTLYALAADIRQQQSTHARLHQELREAVHDATHLFGLPIADPIALARLVGVVERTIAACITVYEASRQSADRAAEKFGDLAGQARAAKGVQGGLRPDDAVVLAAMVAQDTYQGFLPGAATFNDGGILSDAQLASYGDRLAALSPEDRAAFEGLLANAHSDVQRGWLLKALIAGHGIADLTGFADSIRSKSDDWLGTHLALFNAGSAGSSFFVHDMLEAYNDGSCGPAVLIAMRAQDPIYALSLTGTDDFAARYAAELADVHGQTNTFWPEPFGTTPSGMVHYLNSHTTAFGTRYGWHMVDNTDPGSASTSMRELVNAVDAGHPAAVLIGGAVPSHYELVVGHTGNNVLLYNPAQGSTFEVPETDLMNGTSHMPHPNVQAVITPAQ